MRFEQFPIAVLAALTIAGAGCGVSSQPITVKTEKITLQEACDRVVEHGSTVQFAARMKRLEKEKKEALTLTSLPDLENLPETTMPARKAELWFEALENALFYNYSPRQTTPPEAERKIRLREEDLIRGKTASLYWLLAEDYRQLQSGKFTAEEKAAQQKKISARAFELAVHIGSAGVPLPKERFSHPTEGTLEELLNEAGQRRAAMPELCGTEDAVKSAIQLYRECKSAPDYTYGKMVRILFYLPSVRLRNGDGDFAAELDALTFLLGSAAELDLLLDARKKTEKKGTDQQLKIEALLLTARGFGTSGKKTAPLTGNFREAENRMRELLRKL